MMASFMDRRTWVQLIGVLAAARPALTQQRGAVGATGAMGAADDAGRGRGQGGRGQVPMRVSKDQVVGALKLMGLEFTDPELEMMLPGVNRALGSYEGLRGVDIGYGVEPAFHFSPGLPDRTPIKGPQRFETTIPRVAAAKGKAPARAPKAPTDLEEVAFWPVTRIAPLIHSRAVSSTELTKMYIARMKMYSPKLLCLITLTEDLALERAGEADQQIRQGKYRGPLHGIPYGVKDLFDSKGILTTWGAEPFQSRVPDEDATCVDRLNKAGAVLIAKLSMGALAQGDLWFQGRTNNPWNLARGSSGSSAGSASATSAGLVGFSLGTETLGSIVSPSTECGTVGLRPTYGRVSRKGAMALSWTMDKIGPICRGVEDCAIVLHAIYGPDGHDRSVGADPFHWEPRKPLRSLKVGVMQSLFDRIGAGRGGFGGGGRGPDPSAVSELKKVYDQALADLKKAGVNMTPVEYDEGPANQLRFLLEAEGAAAFDDITRDGQVRTLKGQGAGDWPNSFRTSRLIPAVEYIRAQRGRTLVVERFEKFMADWDVIVIPSTALLTTTNLTGNPQVVLKCGFINGLPRSIGFLGKVYDEGSPLRVALAYEQVTEWHKKNPVLSA
jgi:Asp-tRNA(Asn)/Glu-tRNA(Gln) amidotransferase A subunit family amidase